MVEFFISRGLIRPPCDLSRRFRAPESRTTFAHIEIFLVAHIAQQLNLGALGAYSLYVSDRNMPYNRDAYKSANVIFAVNMMLNFVRTPPFSYLMGMAVNLYDMIRGIAHFEAPDLFCLVFLRL